MEETELEALVRKAAAGDREATNALLKEHQGYLKRRARFELRRACLPREKVSTADILQEVSIDLVRNLAAHEWKGATYFRGWLKNATRGKASDLAKAFYAKKRGGKEKNLDELLFWGGEGVTDMERPNQLLSVQAAANRYLDPHQARVIHLQADGWTNEEIAEVEGRTPDAVRKLGERATKLLVERWKEHWAEKNQPVLDTLANIEADKAADKQHRELRRQAEEKGKGPYPRR